MLVSLLELEQRRERVALSRPASISERFHGRLLLVSHTTNCIIKFLLPLLIKYVTLDHMDIMRVKIMIGINTEIVFRNNNLHNRHYNNNVIKSTQTNRIKYNTAKILVTLAALTVLDRSKLKHLRYARIIKGLHENNFA